MEQRIGVRLLNQLIEETMKMSRLFNNKTDAVERNLVEEIKNIFTQNKLNIKILKNSYNKR